MTRATLPHENWMALPATALAMAAFFTGLAIFTPPAPGKVMQPAPIESTAPPAPQDLQVASWYAEPYSGRPTASGEIFDPEAMTAAHRSLPFGTRLRLELAGRSVVVRINDRGPFHRQRDLDLSRAAARELRMLHAGVAIVNVREVR